MRVRLVGLLAVMVLLASCGDDGSPDPASSARATSEAPSSSPLAAESESAPKENRESSRLVLQEGVITQSDADYTTEDFEPRVTFHTPDLAYPFFPELDAPRGLVLGGEVGALVIARPTAIFDPASGKQEAANADLTEWATSNGHVDASDTTPVRVAGVKGTEVTGEVTSTGSKAGDCDLPCVRFAAMTARDSIWFAKGDRFRLISLSVNREPIAIVIVSDRAGFGQVNDAAKKLLATLRFHP